MRIAIISDIHGNLEALKATLKDIEKRNVDKVICLGDIIAKGVHPKECIELIKENCDVVLQGNCDEHFSKSYENIENMHEQEQKRIKWNQSLLAKEDREYLLNLPFCHEFYMSGSLVRVFHATPKVNNKAVLNVDSIDTKYQMFLPSEKTVSQNVADAIIYGHIHHPYMDKIYNKTIINVGSVGNSFDVIRNRDKDSNVLETTKAFYLIIEGEYGSKDYTSEISFQFIKVPYDKIIPKDHFLRKLKENIDFSFVNKLVEKEYSHELGRPAKEPEMMYKLLFLETKDMLSDREVIARAKTDMSYKYFLDLNPEDDVPSYSLLSIFRNTKIKDEAILEEMLQ